MVEKKRPASNEIEEAFANTCAKVDVLLDDTEQFINSKKVKSLDEVMNAIQDNRSKLESFVDGRFSALKQNNEDWTNLRDKFQKSIQNVNKIGAKPQAFEKEKSLAKFAKQCVNELKQEVLIVYNVMNRNILTTVPILACRTGLSKQQHCQKQQRIIGIDCACHFVTKLK